MGNVITTQIVGLKELQAALFALPAAVGERALRSAVATGAAVMREAVTNEAPAWSGPVSKDHPPPGTLKRAIYQTRLMEKCTPTKEVFLVSARKGKKFQAVARGPKGKQATVNLDAFYWTWLEFGHHVRGKVARRAKQRKAMQAGAELVEGAYFIMPNPFMRRAYDKAKASARDAMVAKLKQRISEAVARAKGK